MIEQGTPFAAIVSQLRITGMDLAATCTEPVIMMVSEVPIDNEIPFTTRHSSEVESIKDRQSKALELMPAHGLVYFLRKRTDGVFGDKIGLGRTRNVDICIPSGKVSKYHAYFTRRSDGTWSLTDAKSKNGTFVDGERMPAGVALTLRSTQSVGIAGIEFAYLLAADFITLCHQRLAKPGG